jgi:flagellin
MSAVGSILTNQGALDALNSIINTSNTNNSLEQELSSGLSINSPEDNPAGYITAQGFTSQANGLAQATSNANEGNSLLSVADGALQQQISVTQSLNSIAVQAANGTNDPAEAESLQNVVTQLAAQITTISNQTEFNNISLLNGGFSGVQFQVGANEGQTISLSIDDTSANKLGLNESQLVANAGTGNIFSGSTSVAGGVLASATSEANLKAGTFGIAGYTAGTVKFTGVNGTTGSVVVKAQSSAYGIASAINKTAGTNLSASATNTTTLTATIGTNGYKFTIAASGASASAPTTDKTSVDATTLSAVAAQINSNTNITGITAVASSAAGTLELTQANGKNIYLVASGASAASGKLAITKAGQAASATFGTAAGQVGVIQGVVHFQSSASFALSGGTNIGLTTASTLTSLADIDVTTTAGANTAINVVKFALQGLNNQAGQIGAVQQRLEATINNLNTTSQNVTTALGVVQDANIPEVSNSLTEAQIQAQAGVAALKDSTTLQQSYLSLLG